MKLNNFELVFCEKLYILSEEIMKQWQKRLKTCYAAYSIRRRHRLKVHPLQVRHKQDWGRVFILLLSQTAVPPGSDAGNDVIKQHRVSSSKIVRPRLGRYYDLDHRQTLWGTL